MELELKIKMNRKLFLKDPESTELGKKIIREGISLFYKLGFEDFTFKKLAQKTGSTEAAIYKYFENKHRLLVYLLNRYWAITEYQVQIETEGLRSPEKKIRKAIELLCAPVQTAIGENDHDPSALYAIVIAESNKTYLTRDVNLNNRDQMYKPYKDLCARIADLILEYNPRYKYPRSLASTIIEMSHMQHFFMTHLPSLTDFGESKNPEKIADFLVKMVLHAR